jgi:hypothetical protein
MDPNAICINEGIIEVKNRPAAITYDYVAELIELNRHLDEYAIIKHLVIEYGFFNMKDANIFKSIVPNLLSFASIEKIDNIIADVNTWNYTLNIDIAKYIIDEIYANCQLNQYLKHFVTACVINTNDLDSYLVRGVTFNVHYYMHMIKLGKKLSFKIDCLKNAFGICSHKPEIAGVIRVLCDYYARNANLPEFINILEEINFNFSEYLDAFAYIFATKYLSIAMLDYILENYVSDYVQFFKLFLHGNIHDEMHSENFMQIQIKISKYIDPMSIISLFEDKKLTLTKN